MGLIDNCQKFFKTNDFYEVLNVNKDASLKELKKAYHALSLAVHPDRVGEGDKSVATQKFQVMSQVYFILSDAEKRAVYDETGMVDDENTQSGDWAQYWRRLFPKITPKDIENYLDKYKGSKEEEKDLVENYTKYSGKPDRIYSATIGYDCADEPRYREIIQKHIDRRNVKAFRCFTHESKAKAQARKRKLESEAEEAEELKKELGIEGSLEQALALRGQQRQQDMEAFLSHLEQKYATPGKKKGSRRK